MTNSEPKTVEVIQYPGALFCSGCGWAVGQDTPQGFQPHLTDAVFKCIRPGCPNHGVRFKLPATRHQCLVLP